MHKAGCQRSQLSAPNCERTVLPSPRNSIRIKQKLHYFHTTNRRKKRRLWYLQLYRSIWFHSTNALSLPRNCIYLCIYRIAIQPVLKLITQVTGLSKIVTVDSFCIVLKGISLLSLFQ